MSNEKFTASKQEEITGVLWLIASYLAAIYGNDIIAIGCAIKATFDFIYSFYLFVIKGSNDG